MNTNFDNRIYFLRIVCGPDYPQRPPEIYFNTKINLPCVNGANGRVEPSKYHMFSGWKGDYSLEKALTGLK